MGIQWPEFIRDEELWARAEQERIDIQIRRSKWGWIGHTLRKPTSNLTRHALSHRERGAKAVPGTAVGELWTMRRVRLATPGGRWIS